MPVCYKCRYAGHLAAECPLSVPTPTPAGAGVMATGTGGVAPQQRDLAQAATMMTAAMGRPTWPNMMMNISSSTCMNCMKGQHLVRDCPNPRVCWRCGQPGHAMMGCTAGKVVCDVCGSTDHATVRCQVQKRNDNATVPREGPMCTHCKRVGHIKDACFAVKDAEGNRIIQLRPPPRPMTGRRF